MVVLEDGEQRRLFIDVPDLSARTLTIADLPGPWRVSFDLNADSPERIPCERLSDDPRGTERWRA